MRYTKFSMPQPERAVYAENNETHAGYAAIAPHNPLTDRMLGKANRWICQGYSGLVSGGQAVYADRSSV